MEGFQKHHRKANQNLFKNQSRAVAANQKENYQIVESHWNLVFNHHATYDENIFDKIHQCPVQHSLELTPQKDEIRRTIAKMNSDKAPGTSQLTMDMLKKIPKDALDFVTETMQEFWQQDTDFSSWHITKLNILYKGKGDPQDLNNYRGICLKETCAKIISSIVSHRLLLLLKPFGSKTQFGMTGCQEAQHTLKKALLL